MQVGLSERRVLGYNWKVTISHLSCDFVDEAKNFSYCCVLLSSSSQRLSHEDLARAQKEVSGKNLMGPYRIYKNILSVFQNLNTIFFFLLGLSF